MKALEIFKLYTWLAETFYSQEEMTLNQINERWIKTELSGGTPMARQTFNRHRAALEEIFGFSIECNKSKNSYYIANHDSQPHNDIQNWMLDTLSISNMLMESGSLKDQIVLEYIPAGKAHLRPIINAMKEQHKIKMTYCKFGQAEPYTILVAPYAIKVFKQRWYMLAKNTKREEPSIYALDRMVAIEETTEHFNYPEEFSTKEFFKYRYGVMCDSEQLPQRIVIRAYYPYPNYLRTLPLHHSQTELADTKDYADFEYYLSPTLDFKQELLAQAKDVEVLKPASLREDMKQMVMEMLERYKD